MLVILAVCVPLIPASWYQASASFFGRVSDLPEYYAASWLILNWRGADIYVLQQIAAAENKLFPSMSGRVVPLFMAPPVSVLVAPLALVPVEVCHYMWCALLVLSIAMTVVVIANVFSFSLEQRLLAWIFLCAFGPVFESIRIGQIAPFLLLAFSCALYFLGKEPLTRTASAASLDSPTTNVEPADPCSRASAVEVGRPPAVEVEPVGASSPRGRPEGTFWAAFFLALLSCKPQILIPVMVALAGAGMYKVLSLTILFIAALALASLILLGLAGWQNYLSLLSNCFSDISIMHADQNPTVRGQLLRLLAGSSPSLQFVVSTLSGCVYLLALGTIYWINRRHREKAFEQDWLASVVLTLPLGLVFSPYLMAYDVLLLVPALAIFSGRKLYARLSPLVVLPAVFIGLVYMLPFYSFVHYDWLLKGALLNPFFFALLYFGLLLAVTALRFTDRTAEKSDEIGVD